MPFKIVQTTEKGLRKLSVVPTLWEDDGNLHWPPKAAKRYIKDENSIPGPGWISFKCILKRTNLKTYEEGELEISVMELHSDTDTDNYIEPIRSTGEIDFDDLAKNLMAFQANDVPGSIGQQEEQVQQEILQVCSPENLDKIIENQNILLEKVTAIVNMQQTILSNQSKIALKLASLTVQLDETTKSITANQHRQMDQANVATLKRVMQDEANDSFCIKQIESKEELEAFEISLTDKIYKKKLSRFLSSLFSGAENEGKTCAYKVMDLLFSREFLCRCSWSGGSKGEQSKIPFKNYKIFKKFFFGIINLWDPNFSVKDTENFLKLVLRNAFKRKSMKNLRESTKRSRQKKSKKHEENSTEKIIVDQHVQDGRTSNNNPEIMDDENLQ